MNRILISLFFVLTVQSASSQANYSVTDPEKTYKQAKDYFMKGDYLLAYPLLKTLRDKYPDNTSSEHAYLNQDVNYFFVATGLKLDQSVAEEEAQRFLKSAIDEPRKQLMSFFLAQFYFQKENFPRAALYYERAGYENLSNDQIADAKFELAYSYFRMNEFAKAKPLFNEIHQLPDNKHYADANYYYGYICFKDGNYNEALASFRQVENNNNYSNKVPYYIAQIYYLQGNKNQSLRYAENALNKPAVENRNDLRLLTGQIYFEQRQFARALPLLQDYVNSTS